MPGKKQRYTKNSESAKDEQRDKQNYESHHGAQTSLTNDIAQVTNDRLLTNFSPSKANIAIGAYQDQRITADAIETVSIPVDIDQHLIGSCVCIIRVDDRVHTKVFIKSIGQ